MMREYFEYKAGPDDLGSYLRSLSRNIVPFLKLMGLIPVFMFLFWLGFTLRKSGESFYEVMTSLPGVLFPIISFSIIFLGYFYRSFRDCYLWVRFESDSLVVFWKPFPSYSSRIPYSWITTLVIDQHASATIRYLKNKTGILGLECALGFPKKDKHAIDRLKKEFTDRCPEIKVVEL